MKYGPWAPAWSPDGTAIAFTVFDPSERALDGGPLLQMRILTLASGKVTRLSVRTETDLNGPQWISDGEIALLRATGFGITLQIGYWLVLVSASVGLVGAVLVVVSSRPRRESHVKTNTD